MTNTVCTVHFCAWEKLSITLGAGWFHMCQSLVFTIAQTCSGNRALKRRINATRHGNNFDHLNSVISVSNAGCLGDFQRGANRRSDEVRYYISYLFDVQPTQHFEID